MKVVTCCFLFAFGFTFGQTFDVTPLVDDNWIEVDRISGDLNADGWDDKVIVLEDTSGGDGADGVRIALVFFKTNEGYSFIGQSSNVIMCRQCGGVFGDPYVETAIENGLLSFSHYGGSSWRWSETSRFMYNKAINKLVLQKVESQSFHIFNEDSTFQEKVQTSSELGVVTLDSFEGYNN